jgi:hypothetical protein
MDINWIPVEWEHKDDHGNPNAFAITIHQMKSPFYPDIRFAVRRGGSCLSVEGLWDIEPLPSSRDDQFYNTFRFRSFDAAIQAAEKARAEL